MLADQDLAALPVADGPMSEAERHEILAKLHAIELQVQHTETLHTQEHAERMRVHLENQAILTKLDVALFDPVHGLLLRLDRIEQREVDRKWGWGLLWTAITSLSLKALVDWLHGK